MLANTQFKRRTVAAAMTVALGAVSPFAGADIYTFTWDGYFRMLDPNGVPLTNTSITTKGANKDETPIVGTLTYDTATDTGSATMESFEFFGNSIPAEAQGITMQGIGDGMGGDGDLLLTNMIFNWGGNNGIPVSLVWDATGFFAELAPGADIDATAAGSIRGAVDGTYTGKSGTHLTSGYMDLGVVPIATIKFNTTPTCAAGGGNSGACMGVAVSGSLPLVVDTATNINDFDAFFMGGTGASEDGMGGSPMLAGPFEGYHANFDIMNLVQTGFTDLTPPVLTLNGADVVNINQGDPDFDATDPGATCIDAVDGSRTVVKTGSVDENTVANYVLTYNCSDLSSNAASPVTRTVKVNAVGDAVITLSGSASVNHEGATTYTDAGATCTDADSSDIPVGPNFSLDTSGLVVTTLGAQTVTWSCTGSSNNTVTQDRTVTVVDTTKPVITLTPNCDSGLSSEGGEPDPTPVHTASDTMAGDLTGSVVVSGDTVNPDPVFGQTLFKVFNLGYSVADGNGNTQVKACQITVSNPDPVGSLLGDATVVIDEGVGFSDPGATCQDFKDGTLANAVADMAIDASTPQGTYDITYTCTDNDSNTGTITRRVVVGSAFKAEANSGSNFTMLDPTGKFVGGAADVFFSWDGSLYTDPLTQTTANMFMGSALPTPFFGFPWVAHDIRAFAPGSYDFVTSRGGNLHMDVGDNQIGAHMLFDWNNNDDIDVVVVWNINDVFDGSLDTDTNLGAKGSSFSLTSIDPDGDGLVGVPMADGPFTGFNANFNVKLTPQFSLPAVTTSIGQSTNDPTSIVVSTTDLATITATVDPSVGGGVFIYQGPFTYDWSTSDAALIAVQDNAAGESTFVFDPDNLTSGAYTARLIVTDTDTGLVSRVDVPFRVEDDTLANVADDDGDGIPNSQDSTSVATRLDAGGRVLESSAGKLVLGKTSLAKSAVSGVYHAGFDSAAAVGVADTGVTEACVGGCFDFQVTGLALGGDVMVVLPLTTGIPDNAVYRKLVNGKWRTFAETGNNALASAPGTAGVCPAPSSGLYVAGLAPGHFCVRATLVDGGPNDADGVPNGIVVDPAGVGGAAAAVVTVSSIGDPNTGGGGCSMTDASVTPSKRADWWLLAGVLGWLGIMTRRRKHQQ